MERADADATALTPVVLVSGCAPAARLVQRDDGGRGSGGGGMAWCSFPRFADASLAAVIAFDTAEFGSDPVRRDLSIADRKETA